MRIYIDTSAFVRLLMPDEATGVEGRRLVAEATRVAASDLLYVECASAIARAARDDRIEPGDAARLLDAALDSLRSVDRASTSKEVILAAARLCVTRGLTALDAIQLAAALRLADHLDCFVASDARLLSAARAEGFATAYV